MVLGADELRRKLRGLGISSTAVEAAWPDWWSDESAGSLSASAELSYTVARRLGLAPSSLLEGQPRFVWHDVAKFKNLSNNLNETDTAAITSFGQVVGRAAITATPGGPAQVVSANELRRAILATFDTVSLGSLVTTCWALGIPVAQLKIFPLASKRMHAMSVTHGGSYAILLGHESSFASRVAFTLAHELGHVFLGHLNEEPAVIDMDIVSSGDDMDYEEQAANAFASALLTGQPNFEVHGVVDASPQGLVDEAVRVGQSFRVDPGSVITAYGYSTGSWGVVSMALRRIGQGREQVSTEMNALANRQFEWDRLSSESQEYLRLVFGLKADDD